MSIESYYRPMDYVAWDIHGKRLGLRQAPKGVLSVHAFSCRRPCSCEGFEVYLREWRKHYNGPIWPVFSAKSFDEAKQISKELRAMLRGFVPLMEIMPWGDEGQTLKTQVEAWGTDNGFSRLNHVIWVRKHE